MFIYWINNSRLPFTVNIKKEYEVRQHACFLKRCWNPMGVLSKLVGTENKEQFEIQIMDLVDNNYR